MNNNSNANSASLTDEDIAGIVAQAAAHSQESTQSNKRPIKPFQDKAKGPLSRNIMVIGTGDGGCNIASAIKKKQPSVYAIAYNTSKRSLPTLSVNKAVVPNAEDGSGKDRSYSKEVFKKAAYKTLMQLVKEELAQTEYEYIIITTTADGGTGGGSSPNIAKVISDNVSVPVIILGVYPALAEDAKAQYNTIAWQADVEKTGLPYIIYDNETRSNFPKAVMQSEVNDEIAEAMTVITGAAYGDTNISAIDNRDMHMMLVEAGGRINVVTSTKKPKVGETIDAYLDSIFSSAAQPKPSGQMAMGLFVKGPKAFISSIDTSLFDFRDKYGDALLYTHIEEADDVRISMVVAGSDVPDLRLQQIKERYDDIMSNVHTNSMTAASVLEEIDDPFSIKHTAAQPKTDDDFSGLDL